MYTFLHTKFKLNLNKYIKDRSNLLIALSSGQDSLCLLKLMNDCLNKKQYNLYAVYIDHQWTKNSKNHTQHIINITKTNRIHIAIYQIKNLCLTENEARKIRYKILIKHALKKKCCMIVTGHHRNDQVETLLHNLIRGTSLNGIVNLTTNKMLNSKLSLLRPIINFTRQEITWFCRLFYLPIWSDNTNYNFQLRRNRIRYELVPYLQNFFNPNIQKTLTNFLLLCQEENEYIKENTLKLYIKSKHKNSVSLNLQVLSKQHHIMQKRVLKLFFHYNFRKQVNKQIILQILQTKIETTKNRIFYFKDLIIHYHYNWLYAKTK